MNKAIVSLMIGLVSVMAMAANKDWPELCAENAAIQSNRNWAAYEQWGADVMNSDAARTNSYIMLQGAIRKAVGMEYRDINAAKAEWDKLAKVFAGDQLYYFAYGTWGWHACDGGCCSNEKFIETIKPYIAEARAGKAKFNANFFGGYCKALILNYGPQSEIDAVMSDLKAAGQTARALDLGVLQAKYQKDAAKLNAACIESIMFNAKKANGDQLLALFDNIDARIIAADDYKAILNNLIKATPATEDKAKFLGRLKSELGKMQ